MYADIVNLESQVKKEMEWAKRIFDKHFSLAGIKPELYFIIFPIDDLDALRGEQN